MADNQNDPQADPSSKATAGPSEPVEKPSGNPRAADKKSAGGAWADEKATAKAKHDRAASPSKGPSLGDALAVGGGQQSTPYQLETQADAIAKQTKRGDV